MSGPKILEKTIPFEPYLYDVASEVKLPKVEVAMPQKEFMDVFSCRRSVKHLGVCPLEALSRVLYFAVKPYCIGQDDYGVTVYRSAAPSAGGRHPIDILVGLKERERRQLYLYQPLSHSLRKLVIAETLQQCFFDDVEETMPFGESTLLWFSVQFMRTASKYTEPMSLIWRDVGAQLCCLQQVAKYEGMDSCPIGFLAQDSFGNMFTPDKLMSGGGMIIGKKCEDYGY